MFTTLVVPQAVRKFFWVVLSLLLVAPVYGAMIVDTVNEFDAAAFCTLREAVDTANAGTDLFNGCGEPSQEIQLTRYGDYKLTQPLPRIEADVILRGNYSHLARDKDAPPFRFFEVLSGELTLERLHLKWGLVPEKGGAVRVHPGAALTLTETKFSYNKAHLGGAIYSEGTLIIADSEFEKNHACEQGGAVVAEEGSLIVVRSSFLGNKASWEDFCGSPREATEGGGLFLRDLQSFEIIASTFRNLADRGGSVYSASVTASPARVSESTFVGDTFTTDIAKEATHQAPGDQRTEPGSARDKAAVSAEGSALTVERGTVTLQHTLLGGPGPLCSVADGKIVSEGFNIAQDLSCFLDPKKGDQPSTDPRLTRLGYYGGVTQTYALDCRDNSSPTVDAYPCGQCAGYTDRDDPDVPLECLDQRGQLRPQGNLCDVGAYEAITSTSKVAGTTQSIDILIDYVDDVQAQGIRGFILNDGACERDVMDPTLIRDFVWKASQPEGDVPGVEIEEIVFVDPFCEHDCFEEPGACVADCRVDPPCLFDMPQEPSVGGVYRARVDLGLCGPEEDFSGVHPYVIRFGAEIPNFADAWDPELRIDSSDG